MPLSSAVPAAAGTPEFGEFIGLAPLIELEPDHSITAHRAYNDLPGEERPVIYLGLSMTRF
jgi:hypothetical protein